MSTDNEREIRDRLGVALDTIEPSLPPTGAVMRRGRSLRVRRRVGVAAGLAVVVALAATLPGVIGHRPSPPENPPHHDKVTQNPPTVTPRKLTFSGTINNKPWRLSLSYSHGRISTNGPDGFLADGPSPETGGQPAVLDWGGDGTVTNMEGPVSRNVVRLVLRVPGWASLVLDPVRWRGHRWFGIALPARMHLKSLTAYSGSGEIAHAIPFGHNQFNIWLRPGQHGLARQTVRVGSGKFDGKRWSISGYAGPWGLCFHDTAGNGTCLGDLGSRLSGGELTTGISCSGGRGSGKFELAQAAASVGYLRVRLSDGTVKELPAVRLAGRRFYAFTMGAKERFASWAAYGPSGRRIGSGKGFTC